jgi:heat shock protein HtpX
MSNIFKTGLLLAVLTAMLVVIGGAIGGQQGMFIAFFLALAMNVFSYWFSDKMVLAMYRAQPLDERQAPELHAMVRRLAQRAQIPMPRVYLIPGDTPNAFATGRNPEHAVIAVTEGILRILDQDELEGVLAHELSHVKNRDVLISTIAATMAGAITYLAHMAQWGAIFGGRRGDDDEGGSSPIAMIAMAIVAPIAAMLVQMAVSRAREFQADATGAQLAGRTWGLAKALEKLQMAQQVAPMDANPATAHLFIVNPLSGRALMNLFSTHPPLEERIARLRAMRM